MINYFHTVKGELSGIPISPIKFELTTLPQLHRRIGSLLTVIVHIHVISDEEIPRTLFNNSEKFDWNANS